MSFAVALEQDLSTFFDTGEFATTVTYDSVSVSAIVDYGDSGRNVEYNRDFKADRGTLYVKVSDVEKPEYRDEVIISGDTWYVMREIESKGTIWEIGIERAEAPELL